MATTSLTVASIPTDDNTQSHRLGSHFKVSRTTNGDGVLDVDTVHANSIYLIDADGGANNIHLSAETVNALDERVTSAAVAADAAKAAIDKVVGLSTEDLDTLEEIVTAYTAADSSVVGQLNNAIAAEANIARAAEVANATLIAAEATTARAAEVANANAIAALANTAGAAEVANAAAITAEETRAGLAEVANANAIAAEANTARAAEVANAAAIATNVTDISTNALLIDGLGDVIDTNKNLTDTNTSGVGDIRRVVPGFTDTDYGDMVPLAGPQDLSPTNPSGVDVKILLHLGPVWKLVCVANNANHITFLQLNDPMTNNGSTLDQYNVSNAVEMSALYT